jgi:hypothetical protein
MKKAQKYDEGQIIEIFGLERLVGNTEHPTMHEWIDTPTLRLTDFEQFLFDEILQNAIQKIAGWQEKDLKMKFISFVLRLGNLTDSDNFSTYFEKTIEANVQGTPLKTKTDFMVAKGILDMPQVPYFHFQEWKPHKKPTGDSMAQLLEAFLIAQSKNNNDKPMYGCEVVGKQWSFVIMQNQTYCISKSYDCTEHDDLMKIIAILRKFKYILETRLLD